MVSLVSELNCENPVPAEVLDPSLDLVLRDRNRVVPEIHIEDEAGGIGKDEVRFEVGGTTGQRLDSWQCI